MTIPASKHTPSFDIAIIGAGIAGSALACALSDSPLSVVVIEGGALPSEIPSCDNNISGFDPRVCALSLSSQAFLNKLGVWENISQRRAQTYSAMHVWDGEGTAEIHFDAAEINSSHLGSIVENRVLVHALIETLQMSSNVKLLEQVNVQSISPCHDDDYQHVINLQQQRSIRAKLVVGADGANSFVRRHFGFKTQEWDYNHHALVCTVETEKPHKNTAWQRFMLSGPLALLPLSGEHFCSIVWSAEPDKAAQLMALDEPQFNQALSEASEHQLGAVKASSRRFSFPLRQRHASDYIQDSVVLIADAAHTIHPLAGQGINLGLEDVKVLAEELLKADKAQQPIGDIRILSRYQRRRKGDNLMMMSVMEGFKRLFGQPSLPANWLRNKGMAAFSRLSPLKRQLMKQAMGVK